MDIYTTASELIANAWLPWVVGYLALVAVAYKTGQYFFDDSEEKWVLLTIGILVTIVIVIAGLCWYVLTYPFFIRKKRRLGKTFGFYNWGDYGYRYQHGQELVTLELVKRAQKMARLFREQESLQRVKIHDRDVDREVRDAKNAFWNAWELARSCGFAVLTGGYQAYLPQEPAYEPPRPGTTIVRHSHYALPSRRDDIV